MRRMIPSSFFFFFFICTQRPSIFLFCSFSFATCRVIQFFSPPLSASHTILFTIDVLISLTSYARCYIHRVDLTLTIWIKIFIEIYSFSPCSIDLVRIRNTVGTSFFSNKFASRTTAERRILLFGGDIKSASTFIFTDDV